MTKPIQIGAEIQKLNPGMPFTTLPTAKSNEATTKSIKSPDTLLTMIVLLLECLALAILAHAVI